MAVCVNGDAITEPGPRGERITDADFILLFNANGDPVTFTVPGSFGAAGPGWEVLVDTAAPAPESASASAGDPGSGVPAEGQRRVGSIVGWARSEFRLAVESRAIVVLRGAKPNGR